MAVSERSSDMLASLRIIGTPGLFCLALGAALATHAAHAGGIQTILTVGIGQSCDFTDLQDAIDAASTQTDDNTIIRLTRGFNNQSLTIIDRNVSIDGRWPSCGSNVPQAGLQQTLSGTGLGSVVRINTAGASAYNVSFRGMIIRGGGSDDALNDRGGGLSIVGRLAVSMFESLVSDNESTAGGGIYIQGDFASLTLDENTIVGVVESLSLDGNRAVNLGPATGLGGGIYCSGGAVVTLNDARIRANTSTSNGGGIYLNDCELMIEARPDFVGNGDGFVTLFQNVAADNGGGLYATSGSSVFWRSSPVGSFAGRATGNRANDRGGAVFLSGSSDFVGDWIRIEDNRADGRGGGFAVQDTSNLILRGGPGFTCAETNCAGIFGTRGITEGENATLIGGAIYADSGGNVDVRQAHIFDNFANNGSALHVSGSTSSANLRSVLIARNVLYGVGNGTSTIELTSSASAQLRYLTMAGNFRVSAQFPGIEQALSSIRANGSASTVELRNSILWNDSVQLLRLLVGATVTRSCVFGHESQSGAADTIIDPGFVDTTGNSPDFSLLPSSSAIDRCAATGTNEADIFGRARPQDLPKPNFAGPFDAGAIEALPDGLFSDGFES